MRSDLTNTLLPTLRAAAAKPTPGGTANDLANEVFMTMSDKGIRRCCYSYGADTRLIGETVTASRAAMTAVQCCGYPKPERSRYGGAS
jgi:hypothetical protein